MGNLVGRDGEPQDKEEKRLRRGTASKSGSVSSSTNSKKTTATANDTLSFLSSSTASSKRDQGSDSFQVQSDQLDDFSSMMGIGPSETEETVGSLSSSSSGKQTSRPSRENIFGLSQQGGEGETSGYDEGTAHRALSPSAILEGGLGSLEHGLREEGGDVEKSEATLEEEIEKHLNELCDDSEVPMVFRWEGGGRNVYITGTFNKWSEKIPMHRSGNDFSYIHELKKGKHAFKYIVDNEWRFAPDQPTVADQNGYINNFVDLTTFERTFGPSTRKALASHDPILEEGNYGEYVPDPDDPQFFAKEPPQLPPHLRQIILNNTGLAPEDQDSMQNAMPLPQSVTLNHLYCSAIKDNLMVLGVTQRFRDKYISTVFYSPLPTNGPQD